MLIMDKGNVLIAEWSMCVPTAHAEVHSCQKLEDKLNEGGSLEGTIIISLYDGAC